MDLLLDLKVNVSDKNQPVDWRTSEFRRMDSLQRNTLIRFYAAEDARVDTTKMTKKEFIAWKYQRYIKDYLRCVRSVDHNVGRLFKYLEENGLLDNTLIVYTSDQGFYLGEHGWFDKRFMYEQSLKTPLLVRLPSIIKTGTVNDDMVQNLDFAPTFLELAGVGKPDNMQGRSLVSLFGGQTPDDWKKAVYYHYYEYPGYHSVKRHYGIRTQRYKLIHFYYDVDEWELYDLRKDPDEMLNVYHVPKYESVRDSLIRELKVLQIQYNDPDSLREAILEQDKTKMGKFKNTHY
jgi:arylsulfatase A-like enzyme